jgi:murein DD-endopeptidase MepM/ murein hydrolase activator NlpD
VPRRADQRPAHARPRIPDQATAEYLRPHPLTPLAERERGGSRRIPRRLLGLAIAAIALAISIPLLGAALGPAASPLPPLAGDVAGAASDPSPSPTPAAMPDPPAAPSVDPRLVPAHSTDADGPPSARDRGAPAVTSLTGYRWPISNGRITLPFKAIPGGEFSKDGKLFHDGVDMASFCGAPVVAAHEGVVLAASRRFDDFIGWVGDLGPYYRRLDKGHLWSQLPIVVVIDDGNGYRSMYAHFRDTTVRAGQRVRAGQLIGHEGATGHASGCHVHYGLFSPRETGLFGVRADIIRRMKVPKHEIARIDPLLVLPGGDVALRTRSIAKAIKAAKAAR